MKSKKTLAIVLAVMMILSSVPMFASAAEALKAANVTQWPTISYKNGQTSVYYGQTQEMALTINDDEIVLDASGNQVAGHFEFKNPTNIPSVGTRKPNIIFVPDDTTTYTGFTKMFCADATYEVVKVVPVLVDENDSIPVATEVEPGALLNTSTLSGARYVNPYNAEEPKILERQWEWDSKVNDPHSTYVNESGYYEAKLLAANYDPIYAQVYVKVKGNAESTEIIEAPTLKNLELGKQWKDVTFEGGKAVVKGGTEEVTGTYSITRINTYVGGLDFNIGVGEMEIELTFKPDDTEKYLSSTTTVTVTIEKAPIKFVDENGNEVVPEYTIPYGYALNNYEAGIFEECKKYLNTGDENIRLYFSEEDSKTMFPVGTHELTIGAAPYYTTSNYLKNEELKVKITVEPVTITPAVKASTEGYYVEDNSGTYKVKGTFDVYVDGELYKSGVAYLEKVAYVPETSGTHEIKFVYNPVENDNFIIENEMTTTLDINLTHSLTASDNILYGYGDLPYGSSIEIAANVAAEDFAGWKITDANGNEITLDGVDNSSTKITITMPDHDIHVEALEKSSSSGGGLEMPDLGDLELPDLELDADGDHKFKFVNIIQNLIEMLKNFIKQIGQTIEGIL